VRVTGASSWDAGFRRGLLPRPHPVVHRAGRTATRAIMGGEAHRERTAGTVCTGSLPDPTRTAHRPDHSHSHSHSQQKHDQREGGSAPRTGAGLDPAAPMVWRRPACAPGLRFASRDDEVIIRYRYAGRTRELRIPIAVWAPFVADVRRGTLDRLASIDDQPAWTSWGAGAGAATRCPPDEILLRYGDQPAPRESRLPAVIWDQILVAVRAHAVDDLTRVDLPGDGGPPPPGRRPSGFLTLHGTALGPRGSTAITPPERTPPPPQDPTD